MTALWGLRRGSYLTLGFRTGAAHKLGAFLPVDTLLYTAVFPAFKFMLTLLLFLIGQFSEQLLPGTPSLKEATLLLCPFCKLLFI